MPAIQDPARRRQAAQQMTSELTQILAGANRALARILPAMLNAFSHESRIFHAPGTGDPEAKAKRLMALIEDKDVFRDDPDGMEFARQTNQRIRECCETHQTMTQAMSQLGRDPEAFIEAILGQGPKGEKENAPS